MKPLKFIMPFGMLSVISFFTMIIIGQTLRQGYNPITSYISELTADGAPYANMLKVFLNISHMCLLIFAVGMSVISFIKYRTSLRFGYSSLFVMALISIIGFDLFPMTIDYIMSLQNVFHILITSAIICLTIVATIAISYGYLKYEKLKRLGRISLVLSIIFTIFNIVLLVLMIQQSNFVGIIQRVGIYSFYVFIFIISCIDTFRFEKATLS